MSSPPEGCTKKGTRLRKVLRRIADLPIRTANIIPATKAISLLAPAVYIIHNLTPCLHWRQTSTQLCSLRICSQNIGNYAVAKAGCFVARRCALFGLRALFLFLPKSNWRPTHRHAKLINAKISSNRLSRTCSAFIRIWNCAGVRPESFSRRHILTAIFF